MTVQRRTYRIKGLVQGVGFRPTLWRVAHALKLAGEVWNDAQGVGAILEGDVSVLDCFEEALRKTVQDEAPLARIDSVELVQTQPPVGATDFVITASRQGVAHTMVTPDAATCKACATVATAQRPWPKAGLKARRNGADRRNASRIREGRRWIFCSDAWPNARRRLSEQRLLRFCSAYRKSTTFSAAGSARRDG